MKTSPSLRLILATAMLSCVAATANAQRGRGGAAAAPPPRVDTLAARPAAMAGLLTVAQQAAVDSMNESLAPLATAATDARQALTSVGLSIPRDDAAIRAAATSLQQAEQALAVARADRFAALLGELKLTPEQRASAIARVSSGGGRGGLMAPRMADDSDGFVPIFDGVTLNGWDGDPTFWRAEDGAIIGESTPEKVVQQNTFIIWRGAIVRDFELKAEFRINGTNSGIQYRSHEMPDVAPWVLSGYQADMDINNSYTGGLGEERGRRNVMVPRGQMIRLVENDTYKQLGTLGDPAEIADSFVPNGWNSYHIIARGPVLIHILNGRVAAIMIDEDEANRAMEGVIGFQMHVGQPFKVEYRNILYKEL